MISEPAQQYKFRRVKLCCNYRNTRKHNRGSEHILFYWSAIGWGFGELAFSRIDGQWSADTERMSLEFVRQALQYYLDGGAPSRKKWNRRWSKRRQYPVVLVLDILENLDSLETDWNYCSVLPAPVIDQSFL